MPGINFRQVEMRHFTTPEGLAEFQNMWREAIDQINQLTGVHGPIKVYNHIDMNGNLVRNAGSAKESTDLLTQSAADPKYSNNVTQQKIGALGTFVAQTSRRLNDSSQQHKISSDLNSQGSIPPTLIGQTTYTSTTTTASVSFPSQIQFGDLSTIPVPNQPIAIVGSAGTYYVYPYFDTALGLGQLVADSTNAVGTPPVLFPTASSSTVLQNAAQVQNADGHIPLSNGKVTITLTTSGSGGGGGSGCIRAGMLVHSSRRGVIPIDTVLLGDEIRCKSGWTRVTRKVVGADQVFVRIMLSNGESVQVTPGHPLALFSGVDKPAGELSLGDLLTCVDETEKPVQILELSIVQQPGFTVLLSCHPFHDYLVGSRTPCLVAHNTIPSK